MVHLRGTKPVLLLMAGIKKLMWIVLKLLAQWLNQLRLGQFSVLHYPKRGLFINWMSKMPSCMISLLKLFTCINPWDSEIQLIVIMYAC